MISDYKYAKYLLKYNSQQFRSSWLCLLWVALWPIKIFQLFIYFHVKFDFVCLGLTWCRCGHTHDWTEQTDCWQHHHFLLFLLASPHEARYQHCNFRKNTDRSSNSGSEQPQRNARHSSPYQNQVSRSGQENLEKFKFANWRKILWRKNVGRYNETKQHFILFYWKICLSDQTRTNW